MPARTSRRSLLRFLVPAFALLAVLGWAQLAQAETTSTGLTCTWVGTAGNDSYSGTSGDDVLCGLGGADILSGGTGNDVIDGGAGNDTLSGGAGSDTLLGGTGNDTFNGGSETDTVSYADRTTAVTADIDGVADDGAAGEKDNLKTDVENITGGSGNDKLTGSATDNTLTGGSGSDTLLGGAGNDTLIGETGADTMTGGTGTDTVSYASSTCDVTANLDGTANDGCTKEKDKISSDTENLTGGSGNDTLTGSTSTNTLTGGDGNDSLSGGAGGDTLSGGAGTDTLSGDAGADTLSGGSDADSLSGGTDADTLLGGDGQDSLSGGAGDDSLLSSGGGDLLDGGGGADELFAGTASDLCSYASQDTYHGCDYVETAGQVIEAPSAGETVNSGTALEGQIRILSAQVRNDAGTAVAGIGVAIFSSLQDVAALPSEALSVATTDGSGRFVLAVPAAPIRIRLGNLDDLGVSFEGGPPSWAVDAWFSMTVDLDVAISLPKSWPLDVHVQDQFGAPVIGAVVIPYPAASPHPGSATYIPRQDCFGSRLKSSYSGPGSAGVGGLALWPGGPSFEFTEEYEPESSPTFLTDADGEIRIASFQTPANSLVLPILACKTLEDGYRVAGVSAPVVVGQESSITIMADTTHAVYSGVVRLADGRPLSGVMLRARPYFSGRVIPDFDPDRREALAEALTAADGSFAIGLPIGLTTEDGGNGVILMVGSLSGRAGSLPAESIFPTGWFIEASLTALGDRSNLEIVLPVPQSWTIHVKDPSGAPIQGAWAQFRAQRALCEENPWKWAYDLRPWGEVIRDTSPPPTWPVGFAPGSLGQQFGDPRYPAEDQRMVSDASGNLTVWAFPNNDFGIQICYRAPGGFLSVATPLLALDGPFSREVVFGPAPRLLDGELRSAEGSAIGGVNIAAEQRLAETFCSPEPWGPPCAPVISSYVSSPEGHVTLPIDSLRRPFAVGNLYGQGGTAPRLPSEWLIRGEIWPPCCGLPWDLLDANLQLPAAFPLTVHATDQAGSPVSGAYVRSGSCEGPAFVSTTSGSGYLLEGLMPIYSVSQVVGRLNKPKTGYDSEQFVWVTDASGGVTVWGFPSTLPLVVCQVGPTERMVEASVGDVTFGVDTDVYVTLPI